jgi:hypothetical protein
VTGARRTAGVLAVALAVGVLATGCGSDDPGATAPPIGALVSDDAPAATSLDVVATDHHFELSSTTVAAGRVPIELANDGPSPHQLMVVRLDEGVTKADYLAAFEEGETVANELVTQAGGVNAVDPGTRGTGYAGLEPGAHLVLCYLPTPEGAAHLQEGMVAELTVVDGPATPAPEPVGEISLVDFSFGLPDGGLGTPGTYRVRNAGQSDHELALMRLDEGATLGDAAAFLQGGFQGDQPFVFSGGAGGIEPGEDGLVDLDLPPGSYLAMCFLPDEATGKRHAELGMVTTFTVP